MAYLIRMIAGSKWRGINEEEDIGSYPSHTITKDLQTDTKNRLSVWRVEDIEDVEEVENAAIALCVARDEIRKVEMVILSEEELISKGFTVDNDPSSANSIKEYNYMHRDITELSYSCLGGFAKEIVLSLHNEKMIKNFTKPKLTDLIIKRIDDNKIDPSYFIAKEKMMESLGLSFNKGLIDEN
ncbi:MAG: hypothetical protein JJE03_02985 [Peptostreptococcaceae bacterium]|nr:hypothetical protein [Peptostreptococcaceae bacterium]